MCRKPGPGRCWMIEAAGQPAAAPSQEPARRRPGAPERGRQTNDPPRAHCIAPASIHTPPEPHHTRLAHPPASRSAPRCSAHPLG